MVRAMRLCQPSSTLRLKQAFGLFCAAARASKRANAGKAEKFVLAQLKAALPDIDDADERLTIAYEPIWAIGTGRVASASDIAAMHAAIRTLLQNTYGEEKANEVRILYGGSVKPDNAREILALENVDGALVGGASLTADSFLGIAMAAVEPEGE